MQNTRTLSCVRAQRTMEATKKSKRGEGYVDSGVKILIAVVIGALLLAGLYFLMNNVILPKADEKVTSMFDTSNEVAGTYEIGADVGGGGTGGGGAGGGGSSTGTGASAPMRTAAVGTVVTGGTFKCNGTTVAPASNPWASDVADGGNLPAYSSGSTYTFGDSSATAAANLKWLKVSDTLFVCDRNLLHSISYDKINAMGFVNGSTTASIDGNTYKIRLLSKNEWMAANCIGGDGAPFAEDNVSHWSNCYSWTSTSAGPGEYYSCGYYSASRSDNYNSYYDDYYFGFRPALELVS